MVYRPISEAGGAGAAAGGGLLAMNATQVQCEPHDSVVLIKFILVRISSPCRGERSQLMREARTSQLALVCVTNDNNCSRLAWTPANVCVYLRRRGVVQEERAHTSTCLRTRYPIVELQSSLFA
ncbi:hypothetical protein EVAR_96966_1 [Eumeta japonica]|uniref:Uncharacterized protein n=1 Tax=Eumeta variegata TaxID=151549 RepID=A0A4C1VED9_EUMVA|nr:hypothetical protein EVAR_96966_1 [Eumeta japonica]